MKKSYLFVLVLLAVATLSACGEGGGGGGVGGGGGQPGSSVLLATGGRGFTGSGGTGGQFLIDTTGSAKVQASGTVNATFVVSAITLNFGANPVVVSGGTTTVQLNTYVSPGDLYTKNDGNLYQHQETSNGKTNDPAVSGLTVSAGATLVLVGTDTVKLPNDLLIYGTITTDGSNGLSVDANIIDIESGGKITTSSTASDAGDIYLGLGLAKKIVNRGTIEAKGTGNGGSIFVNASDLVIHEGSIATSGGSSTSGKGGNAGNIDIAVNYGNFYSSGTIVAKGGDSGTGGNGGNILAKTAMLGLNTTMKGDIIISGSWDVNGGNGIDGNGGSAGTVTLGTDSMGAVLLNGIVSAKGGNALLSGPTGTACSGGNAGSVTIVSYNSSNSHVTTPGKIRIAGRLDVRGGDGELNGGSGGSIRVTSRGSNAGHKGIDVDFVGFPRVILNGGTGAIQGGNGAIPALSIQSYPPEQDDIITRVVPTILGKAIVNEAAIEAKGGNATGTGGTGGSVKLKGSMSNNPAGPSKTPTPAKEWVTGIGNFGFIDVSGGNGETGGNAYNGTNGAVYFVADYTINVGSFKARGGNGTTAGGNGGNVTLFAFLYPTYNEGTADLAGGTGGNSSSGAFFVDGNLL